jgi:ubiquinone/menaquinone biosynthesis C-methylase UbiE
MARLIAREHMDDDAASDDAAVWRGSLSDLDRVNAWLGGHRLLRTEIDRLNPAPWSVIDVAAGSAGNAVYIATYLRSRGIRPRCVALDRSPRILSVAAERLGESGSNGVELAAGDARALPFPDRSFDLATLTLALHHFDGDTAVLVLRELARVARVAIVNDLRRSRLAWALARFLFPFFTRNSFTLHDGPVSVLRAYTPAEARDLARRAGWTSISVRKHPGFRFALVGGTS